VALDNIFSYAAALEFHLTGRVDLVSEVLGNTPAALGEGAAEGGPTSAAPEAAGGELIGLIGGRLRLAGKLWLVLGVTYDNRHAVLFRPGLTWKFDLL
jgi:hypothetical protein